jgi:uncharacterized protein
MMYQNPHVSNLAWAIESPPLILPDAYECTWYSDDWYRRAGVDSAELMREADNHPQRLEAMLAEQRDRRLGNYFETLWAYWLSVNPRYELLARNLQIHDQDRTLGELDFIVHDRVAGKCLHWELAIKFYLGRGDTSVWHNWLGPGKKDRLDIKISHLMHSQIKFGGHPRVREWCDRRGIRIDACAVILKGRLFYPLEQGGRDVYPRNANPRHLRSRWLTLSQFRRQSSSAARFIPLVHGGWMAAPSSCVCQHAYRAEVLINMIESGELRMPLQVCKLSGPAIGDRLFIVDQGWADET